MTRTMPTDPEKELLSFETMGPITVGKIDSVSMLDTMNVTDFGNAVLEYTKDKPALNLLLDFSHVGYMSSAALTELLRVNEAMRSAGGSVRLCGLSKDIRKVFQITNLEKLFVIHEGDTVDMALTRFERSLAVAAEEDSWSGPDAGS